MEEMIVPKKKHNVSLQDPKQITAEPSLISKVVNNAFTLYKQPRCKSDEEVAERLNWYFQNYIECGAIPTIEGMALSLGIGKTELWNWSNGIKCTPTRTEMIIRAKEIIAECDAQLVSMGKMPVVSYIFRSKNFHGMTDRTEVSLTPPVESVDRIKLIEEAEQLPDD